MLLVKKINQIILYDSFYFKITLKCKTNCLFEVNYIAQRELLTLNKLKENIKKR